MPERLRVQVDVVRTRLVCSREDLEVSEEVRRDVDEETDPRDGHDPLESDGGGEESSEPLTPPLPVVDVSPLLDRHFALPWIDLVQIIAEFARFGETNVESFSKISCIRG
jgi:hypothetical protein